MSPILVRPVREQFEHDRVIRLLQARYKRKYEVTINPGTEQNAPVSIGELTMFPDLVLFSTERSRKMQATVEVETTESINTLEAMAQWGPFSRLRTAFFLYVPANSVETARRLCAEHAAGAAEIWTYHVALDQVRFTMVHRSPEGARAESRSARSALRQGSGQALRPSSGQALAEARVETRAETRPALRQSSGQAAAPVQKKAPTMAASKEGPRREPPRVRNAKSAKKTPSRSAKAGKKTSAAKKAPRAVGTRPAAARSASARGGAKKVARKTAKRPATSRR